MVIESTLARLGRLKVMENTVEGKNESGQQMVLFKWVPLTEGRFS